MKGWKKATLDLHTRVVFADVLVYPVQFSLKTIRRSRSFKDHTKKI
jgi:hypothetical protein